MTTVYLALGSNAGNPSANIKHAIDLLTTILADLTVAPVYLSKPIGYTDQPDFLNTAVSGQTDLKPDALLARLKEIEQQVGRTPTFRHGPREIDIDIIFYGDLSLKTGDLIIPHPAFRERDFVLQPLVDIDPNLIDPVSQQTVSQLLKQLPPEKRTLLKSDRVNK